jgi:hypothetical protein
MKLRIKVTHDILRQSLLCGTDDSSVLKNCAIALACREIFPDCMVDHQHLRPFGKSWSGSHQLLIPLPPEARVFIRRFDSLAEVPEQRLKLPETEFDIELPPALVDAIRIDDLKTLLKDSPTLEVLS